MTTFDPPRFTQSALCAETDPEAFFPEQGGNAREAKRVCNGHGGRPPCPVREECLQYALDNDDRFGVWGGLSEQERTSLRRGMGLPPRVSSKPANRKERRNLRPEERERIGRLTTAGWPAHRIAEEFGVNKRTVVRVRAEQRANAAKVRGAA